MHLIKSTVFLTFGQTASWQRCWQRHFWGFLKGCCQLSENKNIHKRSVITFAFICLGLVLLHEVPATTLCSSQKDFSFS